MNTKQETLKYYLHKLTHLRVNRSKKNGISPHKPILILSLITAIESKNISSQKIHISPELVSLFKSLWAQLVENPAHHCIFALPFYHLNTSSFWKLIPKKGYENMLRSKIAMKSISNLNSAIQYAEIDPELFNLLSSKEEREILKQAVLEKYFPSTKHRLPGKGQNYINDIEQEIFNEPSEVYRLKLQKLQTEMQADSFEEEKYLRSNVFKRQIPVLYNNTCAISGLQINATVNISLIDACHVIPFSFSFDDTVTNGISLTPTLHRAFDRGLISIDGDYKVLVSGSFNENSNSQYAISQFAGKSIFLPKEAKFKPNSENLKWHRDNVFNK